MERLLALGKELGSSSSSNSTEPKVAAAEEYLSKAEKCLQEVVVERKTVLLPTTCKTTRLAKQIRDRENVVVQQ